MQFVILSINKNYSLIFILILQEKSQQEALFATKLTTVTFYLFNIIICFFIYQL